MRISSPVDVYRKLLFFTVALLLGAIELFIPRMPLFPWLKPGLANIITMIWLIRYGFRDTILFGFLRIWITAFFFGFSFFAIFPAVLGLLFSVCSMTLILKTNKVTPAFGFLGLGIAGAFFHNTGQLVALKVLIGEASMVQLQFPVMIGAAILTGALTGILAWKFDQIDLGNGTVLGDNLNIHNVGMKNRVLSVILLFCMFSVLFLNNPLYLLAFAILSATSSVAVTRSFKNVLAMIKRSWFFLITIFLVTRWSSGNWDDAFVHLFRLCGWIFCTDLFRKVETDRLFFRFLHKIFPSYDSTLAAALLTVELFPELMKNGTIRAAIRPVALIKNPGEYLSTMIAMSHEIIEEGGWGKRIVEK